VRKPLEAYFEKPDDVVPLGRGILVAGHC
jgi:hypothetical protein